ncbi:MAG: FKBP-type peptidyl-prolyl cis-trans isomerase [Chlamydiales bacterium]|nr:FKBP-type peptidyl-prolyl cis-trans isomerase [Chlamydiales bacterium]
MKLKTVVLTALLSTLCVSPLAAEEKLSFEQIDRNKIAETLGHLIVRHLVNPGFELDVEKIIAGIQDEKHGRPSPMTEEEYEQAIYVIQEHMFNKDAEKNLEEANAFLQKNANEKGITKLDDQLQYRIQKKGSGEVVQDDSIPLIHYQGKLIDGTVFASSQEDDEPISLPLQQTIPGFAKGLVGMHEGEKRTLYIHPELAYGLAGHLPPNSLLIFEVEVVKANAPMEEIADLGDMFDCDMLDFDEAL